MAIIDLANFKVESAVERAKEIAPEVIAAGVAGAAFSSVGKQLVKTVFRNRIVYTLLNNNRYIRLGLGRQGGRRVLRMAGKFLETLTGKAKIDLMDLGPL